MNDGIKLEKLKNKAAREASQYELAREVVRNPAFQIVAAFVLIESLQSQKIVGEISGTIAEAGVLTAVTAQQIAPLMPALLESGKLGIEGLTKLIPLLGTM